MTATNWPRSTVSEISLNASTVASPCRNRLVTLLTCRGTVAGADALIAQGLLSQNDLHTSPPSRVQRACQVARSMVSEMNRTAPSQKQAFTPPGWRLRAAVTFADPPARSGNGTLGVNRPFITGPAGEQPRSQDDSRSPSQSEISGVKAGSPPVFNRFCRRGVCRGQRAVDLHVRCRGHGQRTAAGAAQ